MQSGEEVPGFRDPRRSEFRDPTKSSDHHSACCFGCVKGFRRSVQVLLNGIEAIMVLTLIVLQ